MVSHCHCTNMALQLQVDGNASNIWFKPVGKIGVIFWVIGSSTVSPRSVNHTRGARFLDQNLQGEQMLHLCWARMERREALAALPIRKIWMLRTAISRVNLATAHREARDAKGQSCFRSEMLEKSWATPMSGFHQSDCYWRDRRLQGNADHQHQGLAGWYHCGDRALNASGIVPVRPRPHVRS